MRHLFDGVRHDRRSTRRSWSASIVAVALVVAAGGPAVRAQTAAIEGRVADAQGASLVGATVSAAAPLLAAPRVAVTDANGRYELASLAPGTYAVSVALDGFATVALEVAVAPGATAVRDVELALAPFAEEVRVVGVTPLLGAEVPPSRVPAMVSVVDGASVAGRGAASVADALQERLGAVTLEGVTANLLQPTIRFRGFTASPLLGLPQGIAVYQNGVRINEPFGDTVQFDLMPQFAVNRLQLSAGADPAFGLNALGGGLALRLKNGFDDPGARVELSAGSFDRVVGTVEYGDSRGAWGWYLGASRFDETGWRVASPSEVTQAVADLGYRRGRVDAGVTLTYADTTLNGNGPAPVELVEVDRQAVFTFPDTTENDLMFVQGRLHLVATPTWSVQMTGYYRDLDRRTLNGDEAEFSICDDDALPDGAPGDTLCLPAGDDDDDDGEAGGQEEEREGGGDDEDGATPVVDILTGRFITGADALGDGAFNRTITSTRGYGTTVQATARRAVGDRDNLLVLGASADLADIGFASNSEVGTLTPERTVAGSGRLAGLLGQAPDDLFNTDIETDNRAAGLYFSDTLSLTPRAHLTVSGRFNWMRIAIRDRLGTSLDGEHAFSRFNPGVGMVVEARDTVSFFGRYSESNRAPTAAELSCADPAEPCRVPNAFVSDPPLEQAVARSLEGGLRGRWSHGAAGVEWSAAVYRTRIDDDILFVASSELLGTGFFQNAGDTQRIGVDVDLSGQVGRTSWYVGYGLVEATFESPLELPGNDEVNDAATEEGTIAVAPGDRLAGIPRHSLKAGVRQPVTAAWDVALQAVAASSRVFVGDEGNDQAELDGYGVVNLRTAYRVTPRVELFLRVDNLFDTEYETFGALAELEVPLAEVPDADDPRFVGPGFPRSAFAGMRVTF